MAKRIRVSTDKFADAIMEALEDYGGYIGDVVVRKAVHDTAEETAEIISNAAPRRTGSYADSIQTGFAKRRNNKYTETVFAYAPHYRLTHLLERPHATRNGGRTVPKVHWSTGTNGVIQRFVGHLKEHL